MIFSPEQECHVRMMKVILRSLEDTPLVLKGGTALLLCYELGRFSEDLDFDCPKKLNLESRIEAAVRPVTVSFALKRTKDTSTVQRYRLEYRTQASEGRLKIEISFRDAIVPADVIQRRGIRTYLPSRLIQQKLSAFENRTAARDLYDLCFLARHYRGDFSKEALLKARELMYDLNAVEARFRPAFDEDDLFRKEADLLPDLLMNLQEALA
jgi:predicted nucleotidyltransferase component of viral defense system